MAPWNTRHAKSPWDGRPRQKIIAVLFGLTAVFGIVGLGYILKPTFGSTIRGCGFDEAYMNTRSRVLLAMVEQNYGKPKPMADGSERVLYAAAKFDIEFIATSEPCDSFFSIRVPIQGDVASPVQPNRQMEVLESQNLDARYERGPDGTFLYDADSKTYYLSYVVPLNQLRTSDLISPIEERCRIGAAWRKIWFEEVGRMAMGEEAPPKASAYPPVKNPDSALRDADEFLMDAGQRRIYNENER